MSGGYCATHGSYQPTTAGHCPQCGSHARLIERPLTAPAVDAVRPAPSGGPPEDHSTRKTKFFQPGLGPCICEYCGVLPWHETETPP
jgi:hypothetical protein